MNAPPIISGQGESYPFLQPEIPPSLLGDIRTARQQQKEDPVRTSSSAWETSLPQQV